METALIFLSRSEVGVAFCLRSAYPDLVPA